MMRRLAVAMLALLLGGCAASFQPMGPAVHRPAVAGRALVADDGTRLPLRIWRPAGAPRAVIVAVHGFDDYSNAFTAPAEYFAAHGIATYAYDQRGFGRAPDRGIWPGTATLVADLDAAVAAVHRAEPGVPLYILGESMGGAVAAVALTDGPKPRDVAGTILSAPAVWGRQTMGLLNRVMLWLSVHTFPGLPVKPPDNVRVMPSDNIPMLIGLSRDPLVIKATRIDTINGLVDLMSRAYATAPRLPPGTLVLFGAHEQVLSHDSVQDFLKHLAPDVRRAIYPGGYHMLLRDLDAKIPDADIVAWIEDPRAPLPSGADRNPPSMAASKPFGVK